jgi:hypothetical protein
MAWKGVGISRRTETITKDIETLVLEVRNQAEHFCNDYLLAKLDWKGEVFLENGGKVEAPENGILLKLGTLCTEAYCFSKACQKEAWKLKKSELRASGTFPSGLDECLNGHRRNG